MTVESLGHAHSVKHPVRHPVMAPAQNAVIEEGIVCYRRGNSRIKAGEISREVRRVDYTRRFIVL